MPLFIHSSVPPGLVSVDHSMDQDFLLDGLIVLDSIPVASKEAWLKISPVLLIGGTIYLFFSPLMN